jgi:hypothetical protein
LISKKPNEPEGRRKARLFGDRVGKNGIAANPDCQLRGSEL